MSGSPTRLLALSLAVSLAAIPRARAADAGDDLLANETIVFSVTGDAPYGSNEIATFQKQLDDHDLYSNADFLVHVGDIKQGSDSCDLFWYQNMAAQLRTLSVPAFIIPGDNEWTDCADRNQAWQFWKDHLLGIEASFCGVPVVEKQSVRTENFAFLRKGVLFIGINLVGGSNDQNVMQDDADWVRDQFLAKKSQARAAVVFSQAGPGSNRSTFFDRFVTDAAAFAKPVLFIHGDGHAWIQDKPFSAGNVTRVQIERGTKPPVAVTVALSAAFSFNRTPWSGGSQPFDQPPCADAGPDRSTSGSSLTLAGKASDDGEPMPAQLVVLWSKLSGPGTVSFSTPNATTTSATFGASGSYVLRLTANDGSRSSSDDANVQVGSASPNVPPVAERDHFEGAESATLAVAAPGVLANDTDADGNALTAALVTPPQHGTLTLQANGGFTYAPAAGYVGLDRFVYKANDGAASSANTNAWIAVGATFTSFAPSADAYVRSSRATNNYGTSSTIRVQAGSTVYNGYLKFDVSGVGPVRGAYLRLRVTDPGSDGGTVHPVSNFYAGTTTPWLETGLTWSNAPGISSPAVASAGAVGDDTWIELDLGTTAIPGTGTWSLAMKNGSSDIVYYGSRESSTPPELVIVALPLGANAPPVAGDDAYTTSEDVPFVTGSPGVLANDSDPNGDPLSAAVVSGPSHGTLDLAANGSFTYAPAANYFGADTFTYRASDGRGGTDTGSVNFTVTAVNDPPVAQADAYSVEEDAVLQRAAPGVLANDTDVDGDALTANLVSGPANGTLALAANGSFTYTPAPGYFGPDSFTYRTADGKGGTATASVQITVTERNDPPVATGDSYATDEDTPLGVASPGVLGNDTDANGHPLTATLVSGPDHGTMTLASDGSFVYTPDADYAGPDTFTYSAQDGRGGSDTASVAITVRAVSDAPVAASDAYTTIVNQSLVVAAPGVLANDSDADGDALAVTLTGAPAWGSLSLGGDGGFTYVPAPDYLGPDSFTYEASDGATTAQATVALTVQLPPPVTTVFTPTDDAYVSSSKQSSSYGSATDLRLRDSSTDYRSYLKFGVGGLGPIVQQATLRLYCIDASSDGGKLYAVANEYSGSAAAWTQSGLTWSNAPAFSGTPLGNAGNVAAGVWVDLDVTSYITGDGIYSFGLLNASSNMAKYSAKEGSNPAQLVIASSDFSAGGGGANTPPVAGDDDYTVDEDASLGITAPGLLQNDTDADGDALQISANSAPAHGTLNVQADGSFTYTPAANYSGSDGFTYTAGDGRGGVDTGSVTLTVRPVNDLPVAVADAWSVLADAVLTVAAPGVLVNDTDVDSGALTAVLVADVSHGALSLGSDGGFTYTPEPGYIGPDAFTYEAHDGLVAGNTVNVALTVTASGGGGGSTQAVEFQEIQSGGSTALGSVATSSPLAAVPDHVYLAAITSKSNKEVVAVSGLGLTWTRVRAQCGGRSQTGIEVWVGTGAPIAGVVTATFAAAPLNACIAVARYSGVDPAAPVGTVLGANTLGVDGACDGGVDGAGFSLPMSLGNAASLVFAATAMRARSLASGAGWIEHADFMQGTSGGTASVAVIDKTPGSPTVTVDGSFGDPTDWALVAVEVRPRPAPAKAVVAGVETRVETALERIVPNPFRAGTWIHYGLARDARVEVAIFNARGQRVRHLAGERQAAGRRALFWNGTDDHNTPLPAGVYFLRAQLGERLQTRKVVLQR